MTTTQPTPTSTEGDASQMATLAQRTKRTLAALNELREHVRVQVHLGGMEARDAWEQRVAPRMESLVERLSVSLGHMGAAAVVPEDVKLRAHLGAMDARDEWRTLEAHVAPIVERVRAGGASIADVVRERGGGWEEAKQAIAAIAEVDAPPTSRAAAVETLDADTRARAERVRAQLAAAGRSFEVAAHDAIEEIGDAARRLREKL
ncbi:MAG: hypothetical protein IT379_00275 [Deltaproteobacteria bacterium]|nr:hypothetical protein [Deltaproteobacteria bacterium]